jgi:phosphoribosyl-ATP pyrophosphohydrolase/phosphoribosyl-AMP cyclohydrolase
VSLDVDALQFDERGLVTVVAQDAVSGDVLMVAWADREALEKSVATGRMHYHSRSRGRLWRKGETSGHEQEVVDLTPDCDMDTVLARVVQHGVACHTGRPTCFTTDRTPGGVLTELAQVIASREDADPEASYTARLLRDRTLRNAKVDEEASELVKALDEESRERAAEEAADLVYHAMVALWGRKVSFHEVLRVLRGRER